MAPFRFIVVAVALGASLANARLKVGVTPIQQVLTLLQDMVAKGTAAKQEEETKFAAFAVWCEGTRTRKKGEIAAGTDLMAKQQAKIQKAASHFKRATERVHELEEDVDRWHKDQKSASTVRAREKEDYTATTADFSESIDAIGGAIATLSKQDVDRPQADAALLQLQSKKAMPTKAKKALEAFMQQADSIHAGSDGAMPAAPEANAYEFQSGGIVDLLEKLRDEFTAKKSEAEKEASNSRHAYQMVSQDLRDSIENSESDISTKTGIKQQKTGLNAEKKKQLGVTTSDHDEDTKYLSELKTECFEKTESFKEKQDLRTEEIAAIGQAIDILKSPDVLGSAEEHLPSAAALMQSLAGTSLAQLRANQEEPNRAAAVNFLRTAGRRLHSQNLGMIAEKMSIGGNPFQKVKKMIDDMITKLLEETNQESEQKGFCDKELGTNKQTRDKLQGSIDELNARIDEGEAQIVSATQRLSELAKEVAELADSMKQATDLRQEEKAKNAATVKDAEEALKAIEAATAVLKDFYEKASSATALLQEDAGRPTMGSAEWTSLANPNFEGTIDKGHKEGQQTFGKKYTGMQDEAGGVFAMLEVIASDFQTLKAETESSEATAAKTYKDFMTESKKSTSVKNKDSEMLTNDRTTAESDKQTDTKDLKATQDQLLAADRYYDKLKPTCVDSGISYGDRVKAREEEIQSLKEALTILQGQ